MSLSDPSETIVYWDMAVAQQEWLEFYRSHIVPTLSHREEEEIWGWQEPEASPATAADCPVRTWEEPAARATISAAASTPTRTWKKRAAVAWATAKKKMMAKSILKFKHKLKSSPKDVTPSETS